MDALTSMLSHWQGAVAVVLVLSGLIFFHELGHFVFARLFGMGVRTFSLGFGPALCSVRRGKIDYCLSLVPLGGYVSLVGQGGVEENLESDPEDTRVFELHEQFYAHPVWQRMIVIAAGPVANFILAWLIYVGLALTQGAYYQVPETGSVMEGSPAAMAGLAAGDVITHVNGEPIREWPQLSEAVQLSGGAPLTLTLVRGGTERAVTLTPREAERTTLFGERVPGWQIGVVSSGRVGHRDLGPLHAVQEGCRQTWGMIALTGEGIVKLVQRVVPMDAVGGPILIAQAVGQQAREGADAVLLIAALISVNLGLLNLLPIPILDGGLLVFMGLELLFRRPINARVQEASARVGLVLLIGLMLFATWNDIMRLLS